MPAPDLLPFNTGAELKYTRESITIFESTTVDLGAS
jgi:hypothetical protein